MAGLHLERGQWYAWQMLPGYSGVIPYFSPIRVDSVTPKKAGHRRFRLSFLNAMYATGVQLVEMELHILKHDERYLIAEIDDETEDDRSVVISPPQCAFRHPASGRRLTCPGIRPHARGHWLSATPGRIKHGDAELGLL